MGKSLRQWHMETFIMHQYSTTYDSEKCAVIPVSVAIKTYSKDWNKLFQKSSASDDKPS